MSRMGAFLALSLALAPALLARSPWAALPKSPSSIETPASLLSPHLLPWRVLGGRQPGARYAIEIRNRPRRAAAGGDLGRRRQRGLGRDCGLGSNRLCIRRRASAIKSPVGGKPTRRLRRSPSPISQFLRGAHRAAGECRGHRRGDFSRAPAAAGLLTADDRRLASGRIVARTRVARPQGARPRERVDRRSAAGSASAPCGQGRSIAARQSLTVAARSAPAPKLGTGHGEREYSYVNHTEFSRLQTQPNEIIRIRYDSFDNLLAMGIVKRPRPAAADRQPFSGLARAAIRAGSRRDKAMQRTAAILRMNDGHRRE